MDYYSYRYTLGLGEIKRANYGIITQKAPPKNKCIVSTPEGCLGCTVKT